MIPHDPNPRQTRADAWRQVARNLSRAHPEFTQAATVAERIARRIEGER